MFSTKLMLEFDPLFYFHARNIYQNPLIFAGKKYTFSVKYGGILIFNCWTPWIQLPFLLFLVLHQFLYQQISFLTF